MAILENVKAACKAKGVTVAELERSLDMAKGSVYKWDVHSPSVSKVVNVAEFLGVDVNELIRKEE